MKEVKLVGVFHNERGESGVVPVWHTEHLGMHVLYIRPADASQGSNNRMIFTCSHSVSSSNIGGVLYVAALVPEDEAGGMQYILREKMETYLKQFVSTSRDKLDAAQKRLNQYHHNLIKACNGAKFVVLTDDNQLEVCTKAETRGDQFVCFSELAGCSLRGKMGDFKKVADKVFFAVCMPDAPNSGVEELLRNFAADQLMITAEQHQKTMDTVLARAAKLRPATHEGAEQ